MTEPSEAPPGRVGCASLHEAVTALVRAAGTPEEIATVVADVLVGADLAGHDSHGVVHLPGYLEQAARGHIVVDARPTVLKQSPASALVDARGGWGAYGAMAGIELAAAKARAGGVGAVSLANARHIGRLGHYVEHAAAQGLVAMVSFGAGAPGTHLAAPFGGTERALSTNPIAFGVPAGGEAAFVLDYATTAIANARTWALREAGEPLPPGCALDRTGAPTTDPGAYLDGGSLVIFGGHKGYALSLLTCLLGGLSGDYDSRAPSMEGPFFLAIDVAAFQPLGRYQEGVQALLEGMRALTPAPGFEEVLVPGDPERRSRQERLVGGIPIPLSVRAGLADWGTRLGVGLAPEITNT